MNKPKLTKKQERNLVGDLKKWERRARTGKDNGEGCYFCAYFPCRFGMCPLKSFSTCCDGDYRRWNNAKTKRRRKYYAKKIAKRIETVLKEWGII